MAFTRQDMAWYLFLFTCNQTCHIVAFHEAQVERHIMHISTWLATKLFRRINSPASAKRDTPSRRLSEMSLSSSFRSRHFQKRMYFGPMPRFPNLH